jgi:autotransporter-associated beta strand protein
VLVAMAGLLSGAARAQDATWLTSPSDGDFNNSANWSPAAVPTVVDTAFFDTSATTALSFSATTMIGGWTFNAGASGYTFSNSQFLIFNGAGIVINGGSAAITNSGFIFFYGTSTAGTAAITNNGGSSLNFYDTSTAGSAAITNNGDLLFNDASTAGGAAITNNGGLDFLHTSTAGSAAIINNGGSLLTFNDTSTAGSASITNSGFLLFNDASTAGSAAITNGVSGLTDFSHSSGPNGDHKLSAGSLAGGGAFRLGANELTVGSNNLSTTVTGVIADGGWAGGTGGSLVKIGTGTLALSGTNTYIGATTVNGGLLEVDGSIAASRGVTVNSGGALGGTGTVSGTTVAAGGILAPGQSIGTLSVIGNLTFNSGATYAVDVSPTAADRTRVTGTATLGGASVNASFAPGSYVAKQYTILSATSGVSGTFASLTNTNLPSGFTTSLSYDANDAYLDLSLAFVPPPGARLNGNQRNVGNAIIGFFNSNGSIPLVFGGLTPGGLTQLSGEIGAGSQQTTFQAMNQFMGLMTDPFIAGRGDPISAGGSPNAFSNASLGYAARGQGASEGARDAYAAIYAKAPPLAPTFEQRWSVWAAGFGGSQTTAGTAATGSNNTASSLYGTAVGADYSVSPDTLAGFALAGGGTNFSVNALGSGRSDLFQAGAFVRHNVGAAYLTGAIAYGWQDVTTDRTVAIAGIDRLRAEFNANTWSGRLEGGYRLVAPWIGGVGVTPYAAGQFTTFDLPNYAEAVVASSSTFALSYAAKSVTDTRTELGLRTDKSFAMPDGVLTLRGRAAWAHDLNPDRAVAATFQTLPGASFVVNGAAQASDAALTSASAEIKWLNGWSVAATFEGEFSNVTRSYAGKGVVRYLW